MTKRLTNPCTFSLADVFTDELDHGDNLILSAAFADGSRTADWLTDAAAGTFTGTPDNGDVGSYEIRATATDTAGSSVSDDFVLTVNNVNDNPVLANALNDLATDEDSPFSLTVPADTFFDDDFIHGDSLTLSVAIADGSILPAWLSFDPGTGTFTGTPDNWEVGSYDIRVTVTDLVGTSVSDDFSLAVSNVNDSPVLGNPIAGLVTNEDSPFSFTLDNATFSDDDFIHGDTLTLSATLADGLILPGWLTFDTSAGTFTGTPDNGDVGNYEIRITATDVAGTSAFDDFTLVVNNVNDNPVLATALGDLTTDEDAPFSFAIPGNTFFDDDFIHGDALTLSTALADGSALPDWLSFDATTGTFTGPPYNGHVGHYDLRVTATDLAGTSASDDFALTVNNVNDNGPGQWLE